MKHIFLVALFAVFFSSASAIIYRHDRGEEPYRKLALEKQFDCVGMVFKDGCPSASCVLISENYVLCAAHVFVTADQVRDTNYQYQGALITAKDAALKSREQRDSMKQIVLYLNKNERINDSCRYEFRFNRTRYEAKRIIVFPGYLDSLRSFDIALIELAEPVDGVQPAALNRRFDELGDTVTCAGFGASGNANRPEEVDLFYTRLAGQNVIDTIQGKSYKGKPVRLTYDFDHPTEPQYNLMGGAHPLELEHISAGGDSGGGMFRRSEQGWELVGITSGTDINIDRLLKIGYYGLQCEYLRVSAFYDWIIGTIAAQH